MSNLRVANKVIGKDKGKKAVSGFQGIEFLKSRGQHILKNPLLVDNIVQKAGVKKTDIVLEIGPGTGNLTIKLLEAAKKVIAIEVDPRMVIELQRRVQGTPLADNLQILQGDCIKMDLPYFDICVANTPYQVSSPLTFKLLSHNNIQPFRAAVLMFQREFAMRLVAPPGDNLYCRLSVNAQLLSRVNHIIKVGRNNFRPPPKVDSSVVRIEPRNPPPPVDFREWDGLVRLCFGRRNKTLGAIFRQKQLLSMMEENHKTVKALEKGMAAGMDASMDTSMGGEEGEDEARDVGMVCEGGVETFKQKIEEILVEGGYDQRRSSKMTQDDFLQLLALFNSKGIHFT
ncbi:hypothetical protein CYMTET_13008 [Cymbomonas tetramitiformis]|uniref:rRNA adenine N(6)-methyltransferase n=1 Tax=Cymbomonas tetramitiformis TaxID=36881 RepID=A0AAE0LBM1_9CHLO|nr:hypothetical protein CYMTET_13008 [Cymbomonas tetramitiformis]